MLAQRFGALHLSFHFQERLLHLPGPGLLAFFFEEGELAQMMHIAPSLDEGVALIAPQSIMDAGATKLGRNANGIEGFAPSLGMSGVVGKSIGRADMDPPPCCADA